MRIVDSSLVAIFYYSSLDSTAEWYDQGFAIRQSVEGFAYTAGILIPISFIPNIWKLLLSCIASLSLAVRGKYPDDQKQ